MKIKIRHETCKRCGHAWTPRQAEIRICPKCKSAYFDTAKRKRDLTFTKKSCKLEV